MRNPTGDERKWAATVDEGLQEIAKEWAERFTVPQLKAFQNQYLIGYTGILKSMTEPEFQSDKNAQIIYHAYSNLWIVTYYALMEKCK
jgi:hypothetical protein